MKEQQMMNGDKGSFWQALSLKRKLYVVMVSVTIFMAVAILINIKVSYVFIDDVRQLMDDNLSSYKFQESLGNEVAAFTELVRDWSTDNEKAYRAACEETQRNLDALPRRYHQIGEERYAITWNILNSYEVYSRQREVTVALKAGDASYIE